MIYDKEIAVAELMEFFPLSQRKVVDEFVQEYRRELERHFDYEERVVFPYINSLRADVLLLVFHIEEDLEMHTRVENEVLLPMIRKIESHEERK